MNTEYYITPIPLLAEGNIVSLLIRIHKLQLVNHSVEGYVWNLLVKCKCCEFQCIYLFLFWQPDM
jgi:hypothetical protein